MRRERTAAEMWTEVKNRSRTVNSDGNSSEMVDPDLLTRELLHTFQQSNDSVVAATSHAEISSTCGSGIIPAAIAATLFIAFILGLYAVLWKCMVSPPQRKHSKVRVRVKQKTSV